MLEEVQQGVGIDLLVESFKEYQQAADHPKSIGWAPRITKKGGKYNQKAKDLVMALFNEYYNDAKKLRAEEADKRMMGRVDILPAERMTHEQIKNLIRTLVDAKKKQLESEGVRSRRRRALLDDMLIDLEEEEIEIEEEVDVGEDDRELTAIYDFVHSDLKQYFDDPDVFINHSDSDIGNIDE